MTSDATAIESAAPPAAATPKKGKGVKPVKAAKPKVEKKAPTHPPVASMINDAISKLNEKTGSSLLAIKKVIAETYKIDVEKLAPHLKKALRKGVESGKLIQPKGKGASGSFKLAVKPKPAKKSDVEKKVEPAGSSKKKVAGVKKAVAPKPKTEKVAKPKTTKSPKKKAAAPKPKAAEKPATEKKAPAAKKPVAKVKAPKIKLPKTMKPKVTAKPKAVPKKAAPKKQ